MGSIKKNTLTEDAFMEKGRLLRVCTYNILHGMMVEGNEERIGEFLKETGAEIVGLQEVDRFTARVGGRDILKIVAEAGGFPYYAFARAIDIGAGEYGTAILSRHPIVSFSVTPLPVAKDCEDRSIGHAVIELDGEALHVFNTHLAFERLDLKRKQLEHIAPMIGEHARFLLMGDFNLEDVEELSVFKGARTLNERTFATYYPSGWAIDHIVIPASVEAGRVEMPTPPYSDHYPLVADLYL
jgi:endonuclease/exonuclease/phosphatase family metal-dependent hydrolase